MVKMSSQFFFVISHPSSKGYRESRSVHGHSDEVARPASISLVRKVNESRFLFFFFSHISVIIISFISPVKTQLVTFN